MGLDNDKRNPGTDKCTGRCGRRAMGKQTQATGGLLYRIAAFSALGGFLFGYDLGLIGGALLNIEKEWGITVLEAELIVGSAKFGAVFGSVLGGALMLQYGRRKATAMDSIFFIIGPLVMMASFNVACLVIGRFITGLGIGVSAVVTPAYLGEMAPAHRRGMIVALYEVMLCAGMFASLLADWALNPHWRLMVGAPVIPAVALSFALCVLPESPRWLLLVGDYDGALAVIHKITTQKMISDEGQAIAEAEDELLHLWSSVEKARFAQTEARHRILRRRFEQNVEGATSNGRSGMELARATSTPELPADTEIGPDEVTLVSARSNASEGELIPPDPSQTGAAATVEKGAMIQQGIQDSFLKTLWTMVTDIYVVAAGEEAHAFAICCWLSFFNQAMASSAIINYAPTVLQGISSASEDHSDSNTEDAILYSSPVAASKLVGVLIGMFTIDILGRRALLISSSVGSGLAMLLLSVAVKTQSTGTAVVAMCAFILSFSWGWASGFWLLASELFSMAVKSPAASSVTAGLFLFGFLTNIVFLSLAKWLEEWTFLVFGMVAFLSGLYVIIAVPETKGKTLLQIQEMLGPSGGKRVDRLNIAPASAPVGPLKKSGGLSWQRFFGLK